MPDSGNKFIIKDTPKIMLVINTNIIGTYNLLQASKVFFNTKVNRNFLFHHISTDEVYGHLSLNDEPFKETTPYDPRSPYSASKASSDHFVKAFHNTYGLPVIITNCSNNYGPRQYKEKLIPQTILNLLEGKKVPVYGDGKQVRDWLYVQDHCEALVEVWSRGRVGQKYNIGGECEVKNIDLVRMILSYLNMQEDMIEYVEDRPGHDRRYSTSISKVRHEIKWAPRFTLEQGLEKTIKWYESNRN